MLSTALYCAAAVCIFAALHSLPLSIGEHRSRMHAWFGTLCLIGTWYCIATAQYYSATSASAAALALRSQSAAFTLYLLALCWFATGLARIPWAKNLLNAYTLFCASAAILTLWMPYSVRFADLNAIRTLHLPWGETLNIFSGTPGRLAPAVFPSIILALIWCIFCILRLPAANNRLLRFALLSYLLLQTASACWGYYIDQGAIDSVYLSWLPVLWLIAAMSMYFATRQIRLGRRLSSKLNALALAEIQLRESVMRDELTGIPNHQSFAEVLNATINEENDDIRHLVLLEIRDFKSVNMNFGTDVGDQVLIEVANRLRIGMDENSSIARLQGDRFAILVTREQNPGHLSNEFLDKANADLERLTKPYVIGPHCIDIQFTMGVATLQRETANAGNAMLMANMALKEAIAQHKPYVFYGEKLAGSIERTRKLEIDLAAAIKSQMLSLAYQPKVAADGMPLGAEILSRWQHPELGQISPAEFIPIAERLGLIGDLCWSQIEQVCTQLALWRESDFHFRGRIAVNVSAFQLQHPKFAEDFLSILESYNESPTSFTAEITESLLLGNAENTSVQLNRLREAGVTIAIDDFGTGHSSLSRLGMLPVDMLKIDLSFVRAMHDPRQLRLIEAIIEMGKAFDLKILAEGVEKPEQLSKLVELGCEAFQGYLWSPPLNADGFMAWIIDCIDADTSVAGNSH